MDNSVTVVITSYNRFDLLYDTIMSFNRNNTYPIEKFIIIEDSCDLEMKRKIEKYFKGVELIFNETNQGQVESIDIAYAQVTTPYVFHTEDDYDFYRKGFIERSIAVMESDEKIMQVWIRAMNDTMGQPIEPELYNVNGVNYYRVGEHQNWYGFCFQCGLRRITAYKSVAPYSQWSPKTDFPSQRECKIGIALWEKGYYAAILPEGYARHTGQYRSVSGNYCK